jgi:hypothetical protein
LLALVWFYLDPILPKIPRNYPLSEWGCYFTRKQKAIFGLAEIHTVVRDIPLLYLTEIVGSCLVLSRPGLTENTPKLPFG